jgi:hypothetical protein
MKFLNGLEAPASDTEYHLKDLVLRNKKLMKKIPKKVR